MGPMLGPNAGKIQTQLIFKGKHLQEEVVVLTKVNDTMATTTTEEATITVPVPKSKSTAAFLSKQSIKPTCTMLKSS
jgi:hypothetical protein